MEYENVFKKACLIQLATSVWSGSRAVENSIIEDLGKSSEWLKAKKFLINPELLGPIKTAVHQARNHVQKLALPFPISSLYLVPKESLTAVDRTLDEFKERFRRKVNDFVDQYELAREEAQRSLADLFNESDYPSDIASKFAFEWRFVTLDVPGKSRLLPPEVYEREKAKFRALMEETRDLAVSALREEFGGIVHHLVEKLNGNGSQPKALKASMLNKMREFLDSFATKNVVFQDERLTELVEQAKSAISGVSPYGLQYNESMRSRVASEMNCLKEAIDEAMEDIPRRKIRMAV